MQNSGETKHYKRDQTPPFYDWTPRHLRRTLSAYAETHSTLEVLIWCAQYVRKYLRSLPADLRWRFWDLRHNVETRLRVPVSKMGLADTATVTHALYYDPTDHKVLDRILDDFPQRCERFTFIDLGSGKGKALFIAAAHGFKRVIGVEFSPILTQVARRNISSYRPRLNAGQIELTQQDAGGFQFPQEPLVIYCYNPFDESVMRPVLANLGRSYKSYPRLLYMIYVLPDLHQLVDECGFLKVCRQTSGYAVYSTDEAEREAGAIAR